jgi:hypothetical protein
MTRYSVWLRMLLYGELKKVVMPNFRLISQAENKHDKLLIEIRFRQVYCTNTSKMCYR